MPPIADAPSSAHQRGALVIQGRAAAAQGRQRHTMDPVPDAGAPRRLVIGPDQLSRGPALIKARGADPAASSERGAPVDEEAALLWVAGGGAVGLGAFGAAVSLAVVENFLFARPLWLLGAGVAAFLGGSMLGYKAWETPVGQHPLAASVGAATCSTVLFAGLAAVGALGAVGFGVTLGAALLAGLVGGVATARAAGAFLAWAARH